ncbi:unnamed protein product [Mytilus edulis]|uniref:Uncharacterized protein n=1 Tax=Mytilus edulis TaxID=6550 RepID=A0A8S3UKE4_MYTED|nr:unnamed protein product [Mytilus edulis]
MFLTQETCPCDIHTCFKWKITQDRLTLTCKVDHLQFSIFFVDPSGNIQADCLQPVLSSVKCEPYYKNGSITQNSTTKETIFTVQGKIDKSLNGNWTCLHGLKKNIAKVEVTILNIAGIPKYKNNTDSNSNQCMHKVLFFSMIAYFGAMLPKIDDSWQKCMCITKIPVWKTVCFFTCISLFFGICAVCGFIDDATCISGIILPIVGCVLGCVSTPFFINLAVEQRNITNMNRVNAPDQQANDLDEQIVRPMIIEINE